MGRFSKVRVNVIDAFFTVFPGCFSHILSSVKDSGNIMLGTSSYCPVHIQYMYTVPAE